MYNKVLNQMSETLTEIKMNIKKILFSSRIRNVLSL